jgi:hypothetical protein
MPSNWKTYFVGNALRGFFNVRAQNPQQAWVKGTAMIDRLYPSQSGRDVSLVEVNILRRGMTPGFGRNLKRRTRARKSDIKAVASTIILWDKRGLPNAENNSNRKVEGRSLPKSRLRK